MIKAYLKKIQDKLEEISPIVSDVDIDYEADENLNFGSVKGRLTFIDNSTLDFSEKIMGDKRRYRFHYMDFQNRLISRWDNVPHHREIKTFPSHKHTTKA